MTCWATKSNALDGYYYPVLFVVVQVGCPQEFLTIFSPYFEDFFFEKSKEITSKILSRTS